MELTTVREIFRDREKYLNKEIQVGGWVRSNRDSKAFGFLVLHDGTFFETLQIVYHDTMANFQELTKINVGAAVIVKGTLVPTPEAKQPFEIQAEEISIEALPHRIIRCRRNVTAWSTCVPSPICVREPTPSRPYSACVP